MSQITKAKKVYRFRAIPDGGPKLSRRARHCGTQKVITEGVPKHPRPVLAPGSALGLLLSIALSSGQATITVNKTIHRCNYKSMADFKKRTFLTS